MLFQQRNPTTFISRVQIIYAVLCYSWIKRDLDKRAESDRDSKTVPNVNLGPFIAYFGTYLKFHEVFRLGAYAHPFDLISGWYKCDCAYSSQFEVAGGDWDSKFAMLEEAAVEPFAILIPSMLEGSSLGGPFLPQEFDSTLSDIHHMMGLGSIWTIGPPTFPSKSPFAGEGAAPVYDVYAYPEHWKGELAANDNQSLGVDFFSEHPLKSLPDDCHSPSHMQRCFKDAANRVPVRHVGFKFGVRNINDNHGWTSHLPGKEGLLCSQFGAHNVTGMNHNRSLAPGNLNSDATKRVSFATHFSHKWPSSFGGPKIEFGGPIALPEVSGSMENTFSRNSEGVAKSLRVKVRQIVGVPQSAKNTQVAKNTQLEKSPASDRKDLEKEIRNLRRQVAKAHESHDDTLYEELEAKTVENDELKALVSALQADLDDATMPPSRTHQGGEALPTQEKLVD